jgi:hypothetical protein
MLGGCPQSNKATLHRSAAHPSIDAWIAAVAARQHVLITFLRLRRVISASAISQRVQRGVLHRRYRGIYVVGQPTLSREGEWLACGGAAGYLSCGALRLAAALETYGLTRPPRILDSMHAFQGGTS